MRAFFYSRPDTLAAVVRAPPHSRYLAGGTGLIDLMKVDVERPEHVINIKALSLDAIEPLPDGGLRLGALATNARTAGDCVEFCAVPFFQAIGNRSSNMIASW
ncbi:FAD binding domain-containing protein, partial [Komagataeibacter diospyri]|uniref:FAD binding domain-containing protein n=1 Tax=Komagataeibacter diospyri TaxID=1932662 RepID=UPI001D0372D8